MRFIALDVHRDFCKVAIAEGGQVRRAGRVEPSPATDLFGAAGRCWLAAQELPADEREMVDACLRGIDFLDREVAAIDRALAELVLASNELRRLLTLPGVNFVTACALLAAIG